MLDTPPLYCVFVRARPRVAPSSEPTVWECGFTPHFEIYTRRVDSCDLLAVAYIVFPERETMFSAGPSGGWSQESRISPPAVGGGPASDAVRPTRKEVLALRKKNERAHLNQMWPQLALLAPSVGANKGLPGYRSFERPSSGAATAMLIVLRPQLAAYPRQPSSYKPASVSRLKST